MIEQKFIIGVELSKLGGSDDPLEGTNVTLICRQHMIVKTIFSRTKIQWSIIKSEESETVLINGKDLPEGLKEIVYYRRESCTTMGTNSFYSRNGNYR